MEKILQYVASGFGLVLTAGVVAIAVGEGMPSPFTQPVQVQIEFAALGLMLAGTLVALKWVCAGGIMILGGFLTFEGVEWAVNHRFIPILLLFGLVGMLHLLRPIRAESRIPHPES
jgi:hypothetical protein